MPDAGYKLNPVPTAIDGRLPTDVLAPDSGVGGDAEKVSAPAGVASVPGVVAPDGAVGDTQHRVETVQALPDATLWPRC